MKDSIIDWSSHMVMKWELNLSQNVQGHSRDGQEDETSVSGYSIITIISEEFSNVLFYFDNTWRNFTKPSVDTLFQLPLDMRWLVGSPYGKLFFVSGVHHQSTSNYMYKQNQRQNNEQISIVLQFQQSSQICWKEKSFDLITLIGGEISYLRSSPSCEEWSIFIETRTEQNLILEKVLLILKSDVGVCWYP